MNEFEGIPFEVVRRRVKYSRVEFKIDGLRVVVPRGIDPRQVLEENKHRILNKYQRLSSQREIARQIPGLEMGAEEFQDFVEQCLYRYCQQLNVPQPQIKFRKMRRRWGSCRKNGIVTLNIFLLYLPRHLIAYIIYHELAHLRERGHGQRFKTLICLEFPHYRQLDKELNLYGLKLLS